MARKQLVVANWKANLPAGSVYKFLAGLMANPDCGVDVAICPPFTTIGTVQHAGSTLRGMHHYCGTLPLSCGAQDVHWKEGAFTGAITANMLKKAGCKFCIVGHSERREHFGETDETVNLKIKALFERDIVPIVCVGEGALLRERGRYLEFVIGQLERAISGLTADQAARMVIAYEPIWAIGTGQTATPEQAEEVCAAIRAFIAEMFGALAASTVRILYGGSMRPKNAAAFAAQPNIDGGLVGGASLGADTLVEITKAFAT
jgi:triosephosphate isomerase